MDHPKHPKTPNIPKIEITDDSEAPPDDAAPVYPTAGNDSQPDKDSRKRTHRGGRRNRKKSKKPTGENKQREDGESKPNDQPGNKKSNAVPEEGEGGLVNAEQSKPSEGSTGDQATEQSIKGETIKGVKRWSAGDLDEREDCERTIKARKLVKTAWKALDELARMVDEEEVLKEVDGRFIHEK